MLSRDEILAVYQAGPEAVVTLVEKLLTAHASLEEQVARLTARVEELEARLNKDSHNSHKPPSSDGLRKKTKSLRKRSGKKPGGQPGHPGVTRALSATPDEIVEYSPAQCAACGCGLENTPPRRRERRQVVELPPVHWQVIEHQALHKVCPTCQAPSVGVFPKDITQPVQYGPRLKAISVYLQAYQLLPFERTAELFQDVFGGSVSPGTLASHQAVCAERLQPIEHAIKHRLSEAAVVHFDETGSRVAGQTHWLHSASTAWLTFYALHPRRGRAALEAIGLLPTFRGTAVHDALAAYLTYPDCQHGLCNAHLLRELLAIHEETGQRWAPRLMKLLLTIKVTVEKARAAGKTHLSPQRQANFEADYLRLLRQGFRSNPAPPPTGKRGRPKQSPAKNLLDRLKTYRSAVLAFMYNFAVPFDNNLAERDLRMMKVRTKISGCFRSPAGAADFCRLRGYISTLRKQGYSVLDALQSVFIGQPYLPRLTG